jgi:hypothetical protein
MYRKSVLPLQKYNRNMQKSNVNFELKTNKCINHSMYWYSIFSYMFWHFKSHHQGVKHDPAEIGAQCGGKHRRKEAV